MNWHLSRLCSAVLFGFLCAALVWWFCFWFLFFGLWWLRDSLLDFAQVLYQFTLEAPQFADGHACVNWLINSILQHAIERVGRPGGSHEGVGRKKIKQTLFKPQICGAGPCQQVWQDFLKELFCAVTVDFLRCLKLRFDWGLYIWKHSRSRVWSWHGCSTDMFSKYAWSLYT